MGRAARGVPGREQHHRPPADRPAPDLRPAHRQGGPAPGPQNPPLKSPKDFKLIGKRLARLETPPKVDGSAVDGLDVKTPGALVAVVARCPVFGGTPRTVDPTRAKAVSGVRHVVAIDSGVAVVADAFWPAKLGRDALDIVWDEGPTAAVSSESIARAFEAAGAQPGVVARDEGDV